MTQPIQPGATPAPPTAPATGALSAPAAPPGTGGQPQPAPAPAPPAGDAEDAIAQRLLGAMVAAPAADDPLRAPGLKALQEEREARKDLEKQLAALAPLQQLAAAMAPQQPGTGSNPDPVQALTERVQRYEQDLTTERAARLRAEVAHARDLSPDQAEWLKGDTAEALNASADKLLAAFGATTGAGGQQLPGTPRPDPSQGPRGGGPSLDARIADAQARAGKTTDPAQRRRIAGELIALQNEKLRGQPQR